MNEPREFQFTDDDFKTLRDLVHEYTGIVLSDHKRNMVYSRLARRLRALSMKSFRDYCALLKQGGQEEEMTNLINAITTNLTAFFREAHHFEHLEKEVLAPRLTAGPKKLRIWSSACSAGQEPYSIAMSVRRAIPNPAGWDMRILATDIDHNMLNKGATGIYDEKEWEKIPSDCRDSYCTLEKGPQGAQVVMKPALRQMIRFNHLNLLHPWPMKGPFDAIFCRNVVIYFDKDTQRTLFARMAELLRPGGWLYIGHSESLFNVSDQFELKGRTIYQKKAG